MPLTSRFTLCAVLALAAGGVAHASGAGFTITAEGKDLGEADETGEIPAYRLRLEVGRTVTLVSQGVVTPRGGAAQPAEVDAAAWLFDDAAFQLVPHGKKTADRTKTPVALKALKAGRTRVRFVGNVLGYDRKYDVIVEIVEAKK